MIRQHFEELVQIYSGLALSEDMPNQWVIRGSLSFSATFKGLTISDAFSLLIMFPDDYPKSPPDVQETGGRIPFNFHQNPNRTLCLGAPVEVYKRFKSDPRLLSFVKTLVIEYLYGYAHLEKYGTLPFGEHSHGFKGIREYYQDAFNTNDIQISLALLKVLAVGTYRGHQTCPCGSGNILRKCHGPRLFGLLEEQHRDLFLRDIYYILYSLEKSEREYFDQELFLKDIERNVGHKLRKKKKRKNSTKKRKGTVSCRKKVDRIT